MVLHFFFFFFAYRRRDAFEYFKRIRKLGAYPPWSLCSLLVQLLASEGMLHEADETFADILAHGVLPTEACATMMIRLRVQVRVTHGRASVDKCCFAAKRAILIVMRTQLVFFVRGSDKLSRRRFY